MASPHYDVIVVGGGAAGLIAAGRAAELGQRVLILEKNPTPGQKLAITGGGRCNITNAEADIHAFLAHYGEAAKFFYSAFAQFGVPETFELFAKLGLPLTTQARQRVFPRTERATDVVRVLTEYVQKGGGDVRTNEPVLHINHKNHEIHAVETAQGSYSAHSYIFATGGVSHPETGSTGDGFNWLAALGHTVVPPTPSIVPLTTKEAWSHRLAGIALTEAKMTFFVDGARQFAKVGPVLFTHRGLSGPTILNSATAVSDLLYTGEVTATIDVYPTLDHKQLDHQILAVFEAHKNKLMRNVLSQVVPQGMSKGIGTLLSPTVLDTKVHSLSKDDRKHLVHLLKALPVTITGLLGFDKAVVVDGGVPLDEIDTRTFRSRRIYNLYLIGDLLHINRPSGGFSLQLCWTTGIVAANAASHKKDPRRAGQ